jgi:hypothetical protein
VASTASAGLQCWRARGVASEPAEGDGPAVAV